MILGVQLGPRDGILSIWFAVAASSHEERGIIMYLMYWKVRISATETIHQKADLLLIIGIDRNDDVDLHFAFLYIFENSLIDLDLYKYNIYMICCIYIYIHIIYAYGWVLGSGVYIH
jgi:hypothetical protein